MHAGSEILMTQRKISVHAIAQLSFPRDYDDH